MIYVYKCAECRKIHDLAVKTCVRCKSNKIIKVRVSKGTTDDQG